MAKQQQPSENKINGAGVSAKKKHGKKHTAAMREQEKQARRAAWNSQKEEDAFPKAPLLTEKQPEPETAPAETPAAPVSTAQPEAPAETMPEPAAEQEAEMEAPARKAAEAEEPFTEPEAIEAWAPLEPPAPEEPEQPAAPPEEPQPQQEEPEQAPASNWAEEALPEAPGEQPAELELPEAPQEEAAPEKKAAAPAAPAADKKPKQEKPAPAAKEKKRRKRHYFATYVAIFTVFVVVVCAASIVVMFATSSSGLFSTTPDVALPNFNNLTRAEVEQDPNYRNFHLIFEEVYNDEKAAGVIFDQSPKAPKQVKENASITLRVSKGVHKVTVPDVIGWKKETVREKLKSLDLSVLIKTEINQEKAVNTVLRTEPRAGATVTAGDTVTVYVAAAEHETNRLTVPACVGMSRDKAVKFLGSLGLVAQTRSVASGMPAGTVVSQTPSKSTSVRRGSTVMLSISTGTGDQVTGGQAAQEGQQLYPGGPTVGYGDGQVVPGSVSGHIHTWTAPDANGNQVCTVCAATRHVS